MDMTMWINHDANWNLYTVRAENSNVSLSSYSITFQLFAYSTVIIVHICSNLTFLDLVINLPIFSIIVPLSVESAKTRDFSLLYIIVSFSHSCTCSKKQADTTRTWTWRIEVLSRCSIAVCRWRLCNYDFVSFIIELIDKMVYSNKHKMVLQTIIHEGALSEKRGKELVKHLFGK